MECNKKNKALPMNGSVIDIGFSFLPLSYGRYRISQATIIAIRG